MEDSTFWKKLAKHLSDNEDEDSSEFRKYLKEDVDPEVKKTVKEASMIFAKSEKEIQKKFKKIDQELKKHLD